MNRKLVRITTVPQSLEKLLSGQMSFMHNNGFNVLMISSDYSKKKELEEKEESAYLAINMTRSVSPFKDLISLIKMILVLKREKPLIVHTHTPKAGLIGMLASWIIKVPIRLHTVAGLPLMEAKGFKRFLLIQIERITYFCATQVYPNSNKLKEFILDSNFINADKLKVIGCGSSNGIDTDAFKKTENIEQAAYKLLKLYNLSTTTFNFIFIGRLVKDKGIEELVLAFKVLSKENQNLRLILVGPEEPILDPLSTACLKEIRENPAIIFTGQQADVRPFLAISNALVFPSYREGFPNVPMQAGCFHLPSIVSNINGCNEIIINKKNGLIIPAKDVIALQKSMELMYNDASLYAFMKENARRMIVERYEQRKIWQLILEEYNKHLKNHVI